MTSGPCRYTVVSFHAHPDDEALLTAGTLARAAAEGHRVVLVVATAGEQGLAAAPRGAALGKQRQRELATSAAAIGAVRVELLGYGDSGWSAPGSEDPATAAAGETFAAADVREAAERLSRILQEESADLLTSYDPAGGYGHPDHVQVHRVGQLAARLAGTPVLLEATVDRRLITRVVGVLRVLSRVLRLTQLPDLDGQYTAREDLTHCVDVRRFVDTKRAALRAHTSQAMSDRSTRTLALLLRLPRPLARVVLGREWFREVGRSPAGPLVDDIFDSLGSRSRPHAHAGTDWRPAGHD